MSDICSIRDDQTASAIGLVRMEKGTILPSSIAIYVRASSAQPEVISLDKGEFVDALQWAPSGDALAALTSLRTQSNSILDLLSAVSGHPVYHARLTLRLFDAKGKLISATLLADGLRFGSGTIDWQATASSR
jgi:hypothetical protein